MEERKVDEELQNAIEKVIAEEDALAYIRNSSARIVALSSNVAKKAGAKIVHAECEKVPAKYKWSIQADFTITVFEPNVLHMDEEQLEILLFHELLHVGIEKDEEGKEKYSVVPHDLEDFKLIIDRYGTDWSAPKH